MSKPVLKSSSAVRGPGASDPPSPNGSTRSPKPKELRSRARGPGRLRLTDLQRTAQPDDRQYEFEYTKQWAASIARADASSSSSPNTTTASTPPPRTRSTTCTTNGATSRSASSVTAAGHGGSRGPGTEAHLRCASTHLLRGEVTHPPQLSSRSSTELLGQRSPQRTGGEGSIVRASCTFRARR